MKISILGAGSFGLALALAFNRNNNEVTVWTKVEQEKEELITTRKNQKALPNVIIPEKIKITTDLNDIKNSNLIVIAIPIPFFRSVLIDIKNYVNDNTIFIIASKGIENKTNMFASEILKSIIPTNNITILSGATFAIDLANNSHSGLTIASINFEDICILKNTLKSNTINFKTSNDIIGTQICGSLKNIMAIISGLLEGMNSTETTKALFLTKALEEIKNIISNFDGNIETAYSYCGIGDLILTCTSEKSRNYTLGIKIATNDNYKKYIEDTTVEGYYTLISINSILKEKNIHSPLIECIYDIIFNNKDKKELLNILTK